MSHIRILLKMRFVSSLVFITTFLVIGGPASAQTPQEIVDSLYPENRLGPVAPERRESCFAVQTVLNETPRGPFVLKVINGDRFGLHRATGGSITLNGTVVVDSSQLTRATEFLEVPFARLPVENTLSVTLSGDPDATVIVTIQDGTVR